MKLQPNDRIRTGDIVHYNTGPLTLKLQAGHVFIGETIKSTGYSGIDYIVRPDPEPDLREHVRMLRNFLSGALPRIHQSKANDKFCEHAHAALEQTK